ncbi:hypothetical protein SNE40_000395 [Patella caerulea]|uniref:Farnesoic acid O-methyl transferase domain-containing protein n=1 Tax=Patella caerulea TaxID=87958 RepID=A0AAN8KEI7_PATCE
MPRQTMINIYTKLAVILICLIGSLNGEIILVERNRPGELLMNVEHLNERVFWVRGYADAYITLGDASNIPAMYEISIGIDNNGQTLMKRSGPHGNTGKNSTDRAILLLESNTEKFKPFWIKWDTRSIILGAGSQVGLGVDLQFQLTSTNVDIQYISFGTGPSYSLEYILELSCGKVPIT